MRNVSRETKLSISGLPLPDLEELLCNLPKYRASQIFQWLQNGAVSFNEMSNLPLSLRNELENQFTLRKTKILNKFTDTDGTVKLQIELEDKNIIESVMLVDGADRKTACISTQVGCPMRCVFCKTGTIGFSRNLDSAEIIEQLFHIRTISDDIANIVFMGMGEPLLNITELEKSITIICHNMSKKRVTISTCGIVDGIYKLADKNIKIRLAVSITTADEALRKRLMPVTIQNPLSELKNALIYYQQKQKQRITLECVLFCGLNTRQEDVESIIRFSKDLSVIINLIPWNPIENIFFEGSPLKEPSIAEVTQFERLLYKGGLTTTIRFKKGRNISGACGQLGKINFINKQLTPYEQISIKNVLRRTQ